MKDEKTRGVCRGPAEVRRELKHDLTLALAPLVAGDLAADDHPAPEGPGYRGTPRQCITYVPSDNAAGCCCCCC